MLCFKFENFQKNCSKMPIVRSPAYKFTAQAVIGQDIKTVSLDGLIADGKCETFFSRP